MRLFSFFIAILLLGAVNATTGLKAEETITYEGVASVPTLTKVGDKIVSFTGTTTKVLNLSVNGNTVTLDSVVNIDADGEYKNIFENGNVKTIMQTGSYKFEVKTGDPANWDVTGNGIDPTDYEIRDDITFEIGDSVSTPTEKVYHFTEWDSSSNGIVNGISIRDTLTSVPVFNTDMSVLINNIGDGARTITQYDKTEINPANADLSSIEQTRYTEMIVTGNNGKIMRWKITNPLFVEPLICEGNQHIENGVCELNSKMVNCDENNNNPENSVDIITDVTINYVIGTAILAMNYLHLKIVV